MLGAGGSRPTPEAAYRQAIKARPSESLAHLNLGNMHLRRSEFAAAIGKYDEAIRYDAGMALAYFYKAVAHIQLGETETALVALYSAVDFAPDDTQIRDLLAEVEGEASGG